MDKIINGKRYYLYTSLSQDLKKVYKYEIYKFLCSLVLEYCGFNDWYQRLYMGEYELKPNREIVICEDNLRLVGVAIIKNDINEKKICTLRVARDCQRQGIGHNLVELCMRELYTDTPMITLHKSKLNQFEKLLSYYNFHLEQTQNHYYSIFSTELVFNGHLPEKETFLSKIEIMDIERMYLEFVKSGRKSFDEYLDACIRCWDLSANSKMINMLNV